MKVRFTIKGVRNNRGYVRGVAFTQPKGFPEGVEHAAAIAEARAVQGDVTLEFDIAAPVAAFAFFHDEKNIKRIEKSFLGFPKGGITMTNWGGMSRPSFEKNKVTVRAQHELKLKYF